MIEDERARVGRVLDAVRDALAGYVDDAMTAAHGPAWNEQIADEDAARRPNGRRYRVSKDDLIVLLKAIQHKKIAPWFDPSVHSDQRMRAYASEILNLRHMWAHGDECADEYLRALDTASRLLRLLELPVPATLVPTVEQGGQELDQSAKGLGDLAVETDPINAEIAALGDEGARLLDLWQKAEKLQAQLRDIGSENLSLESLTAWAENTVTLLGPDLLEVLDETSHIVSLGRSSGTAAVTAVALMIRGQLLNGLPAATAFAYQNSLELQAIYRRLELVKSGLTTDEFKALAAQSQADDLEPMPSLLISELVAGRADDWREVVRLAESLNDGEYLPNLLILLANHALCNDRSSSTDGEFSKETELQFVRDSVARARALAAKEPGNSFETLLVSLLRREGQIAVDLDRWEEAIEAYTRADEITDRYPTADPNLLA